MKYKIQLTAELIAAGIQRDCRSCPVALAIRQQTPYSDAIIGDGRIWLCEEDFSDRENGIKLPRVVSEFVSLFDTGNKRNPIKFTLKTPATQNTHDND